MLSDEATVYMAWHLANAFHGIKLAVQETDAARAREILAEDSGSPETTAAEELEALSQQELGLADPTDAAEPDEPESPLTLREKRAERAFRGAVIGIWLIPWQLIVFYLLLRVFVSDERLAKAQRSKAFVAAAINIPYMFLFCILIKTLIYRW